MERVEVPMDTSAKARSTAIVAARPDFAATELPIVAVAATAPLEHVEVRKPPRTAHAADQTDTVV